MIILFDIVSIQVLSYSFISHLLSFLIALNHYSYLGYSPVSGFSNFPNNSNTLSTSSGLPPVPPTVPMYVHSTLLSLLEDTPIPLPIPCLPYSAPTFPSYSTLWSCLQHKIHGNSRDLMETWWNRLGQAFPSKPFYLLLLPHVFITLPIIPILFKLHDH